MFCLLVAGTLSNWMPSSMKQRPFALVRLIENLLRFMMGRGLLVAKTWRVSSTLVSSISLKINQCLLVDYFRLRRGAASMILDHF